MAKKNEKAPSVEELLSEIEETVERLSDEELSLEEAFTLYEAGIKKVRECEKAISGVEQRMKVLTADGETEDFEV